MSRAISIKLQVASYCASLSNKILSKSEKNKIPYIIIKKHNLEHCSMNYGRLHELIQIRHFYGWLNNIFNQVDVARIKDVGPDRACAEWLLRCGAVVKWKGKDNLVTDYNSLPVGNFRALKIESVDATDSAIMEAGFSHFKDLEFFHKLKLKNCIYLTDESMGHLVFNTKDRIEWLELSDNGNVTDAGVKHLRKLSKLKFLKLENLQGVRNPSEVLERLKKDLPCCEIVYNDATEMNNK